MKDTKQTYGCNWPVRHNGSLYTKEIDLTADEAKPLLDCGAVRTLGQNLTKDEQDDEEQKLQQVVEAIDQLDPDNDAHFTQGGKPECAALSELVGFNVSADMRNQAIEAKGAE